MNVGVRMGRGNKRLKVDRLGGAQNEWEGRRRRRRRKRRQTVMSFYLQQSAVLGPVTSSQDGQNISLWIIRQGRAEGAGAEEPWTQSLLFHSEMALSLPWEQQRKTSARLRKEAPGGCHTAQAAFVDHTHTLLPPRFLLIQKQSGRCSQRWPERRHGHTEIQLLGSSDLCSTTCSCS